ncbi:LSm family protein [Nocardia stercoris]|uniref:Uncharacterized protein n=1 Tax=Nocardia stercoris TaxID=2483361 RepID=A0A3M2L8F3_9NOCA|nr:hypothetical protein [Nocardia stercoris]RMI30848.1 hypothetical protein EBN03_19550 [Nocardia stercoris]
MTAAVLASGSALVAMPAAHADDAPAADPTQYSDVTAKFVDFRDAEVTNEMTTAVTSLKLQVQQAHPIIVSPYGTTKIIACRGNGADVAYYDCQQHDDFGWFPLHTVNYPVLGTIYTSML